MDYKTLIMAQAFGGDGGGTTVEPLEVTANGTYEESGKAFSPVTVNVSGGGGGEPVTLTIQNGGAMPFGDEIYGWSWVGEDGTIHHNSGNGFTGTITNIKRGTMVSIFCNRDMTNFFNIPAGTVGAMFTMTDNDENVVGWGLSVYMDDNRTISITV